MTRTDAIKWLKAITYVGIYGGLLMPLMFIPVVIFPFVFSKLIFFQVLIGLTFPAYLILAWIEPSTRPRNNILYLAIVAYFVAMGLSVVFSVDILRSWWGNQERMNGMFTLLHFLAWLTMTIGLIKTWPQWRRLLNYEIALSVFMAIIAVLQKWIPNLLLFPAGARVGGLLDNPIYMGVYQIFNMFFIALLWLKGAKRNAKIWYVVAALFDVAAFYFAESRGDLVGLGVGLLVFAVAYGVLTPNKKVRRIIIGIVCAMTVAYGVLFAFRDTPAIYNSPLGRFTHFATSVDTRFIAWDIAWKGFLERPFTGWGFDAFHILFNQKYNPQSLRFGYYETWFDRSHNSVLDVLSMMGIFGFVTFAAIFITLFWSVVKAHRKGWIDAPITSILLSLPVAYFVQNLFVFDHPAAFSMSYLMFALVISIGSADFAMNTESVPVAVSSNTSMSRKVPWGVFVVLQIIAVGLVYRMSILPFYVSVLSIRSNTASGQGAYEMAFSLAKQAAVIPTPYTEEQTFLQSRNFIAFASSGKMQTFPFWREWHDLIVKVTEQNLAEHPRNTNPHYIFARFAEAMSQFVPEDTAIAEREYRKTIEYSPKRQQMYYGLSQFLSSRGRKDEALDLLKKVVSFDDQIGESHWMLGITLLFDFNDQVNGSKELILSQSVPHPYNIQVAREAMALAIAYDIQNDKVNLHKIIDLLPTLPQAQTDIYLQIARTMEHQGLLEDRNRLLNALVRIDTALAQRLAPLSNNSATSIDAALAMTANLPIVTAPPTPAPSQVATSSGSGPRLK